MWTVNALILVKYDFVRFSSWTHDVRFCMVILVIYFSRTKVYKF